MTSDFCDLWILTTVKTRRPTWGRCVHIELIYFVLICLFYGCLDLLHKEKKSCQYEPQTSINQQGLAEKSIKVRMFYLLYVLFTVCFIFSSQHIWTLKLNKTVRQLMTKSKLSSEVLWWWDAPSHTISWRYTLNVSLSALHKAQNTTKNQEMPSHLSFFYLMSGDFTSSWRRRCDRLTFS